MNRRIEWVGLGLSLGLAIACEPEGGAGGAEGDRWPTAEQPDPREPAPTEDDAPELPNPDEVPSDAGAPSVDPSGGAVSGEPMIPPAADGGALPGPGPTGDMPSVAAVRFIAIGDAGEGNDAQFAVATAVEQVCTDRPCEFAVYLGDNFYDVGVESTMDRQFVDKFEMPYAGLDFPFFVALGNHDYGSVGGDWVKSQYQVDYTEFSEKWTMPSEYYAFDVAHVTFIALDTARLFWDHDVSEQRTFLREMLADSPSRWRVAFGHHPYLSNGEHGNAGNYEGLSILPAFAGVDGSNIKEFFDDEVCGQVTLYLAGHDHNRQWHPKQCGTEFVVSGAGSKTTPFEHRDGNPGTHFEDDTKPGFAWVEILEDTLTIAFYDESANLDYEHSVTLGQ